MKEFLEIMGKDILSENFTKKEYVVMVLLHLWCWCWCVGSLAVWRDDIRAATLLRHTGRGVMKYDGRRPGNGWWNCPFSKKWVERMKRAVKVCERLTTEQVEAALTRTELHYVVPSGDFLSEPQDARGLPLSWCREYDERHKEWPECCTAIYDYDSIPETVVTNGEDDWPLVLQGSVMTA